MSAPANGPFDLVKAAEALLEDAKRLASASGERSHEEEEEDDLRRAIAKTAKTIITETLSPLDLLRAEWLQMADIAAWSIFLEWNAFDHIPLDGSSISVADLAVALNATKGLVERITNALIAFGKLLPGPEPGHVRHSRISALLVSTHPISDLCAVAIGNCNKPFSRWAEYFERYGRYEPPSVVRNTAFSFAWGYPDLTPWSAKDRFPEYARRFARSMTSREIAGGIMPLTGPAALYDLAWIGEEAKSWDKNKPLIVDVGGGLGQLLKDILTQVPGVSATQCVLQDREEIIAEAEMKKNDDPVVKGIVMMKHDFHDEQPVKGALIYFLKRVLNDFPDEPATGILRRLAQALPKDNPKARIIIMEERLLDPPVPQNRLVDLVMLNLGGKLRNEKTMGEIVSAAGLKMVNYCTKPGDATHVVEVAKA